MKTEIMITLTGDEIRQQIPYAMICETRFGSTWDTTRRRRVWKNDFTESERNACSKLFKQARNWYLVKGVPDEIKMNIRTLGLWKKLGNFCASI